MNESHEETYRLEDLRRIIPHRVLPRPLLEEENHKRDHKPHEIPLPKERLLDTQSLPRTALFLDRRLDLCHLVPHVLVVRVRAAEVRKVEERVMYAPARGEIARGFFDGEEAECHYAGGHELEAEGDLPDFGACDAVGADTD